MAEKTAIKTAKPSPRSGVSLPVGAHPGNTGGRKGRSGRPPNAFRAVLAAIRDDPSIQDALKQAAGDATSRNFGAAWRVLVDYDDEKPAKRLELASPLTDEERAQKIKAILAKVAEEQS
jgi:predicted RNA-binding protein YlqC (UPF0109 family)